MVFLSALFHRNLVFLSPHSVGILIFFLPQPKPRQVPPGQILATHFSNMSHWKRHLYCLDTEECGPMSEGLLYIIHDM